MTKQKGRRIRIIKIAPEALVLDMVQNRKSECIEGLPLGARWAGHKLDDRGTLILFVEHRSFALISDPAHYPEFVPVFRLIKEAKS